MNVVSTAMTTLSADTSIVCTAFWHRNVHNRCSPHQTHSLVGCVSEIKGLSATHRPTSSPCTTGAATSLQAAYSNATIGQLLTKW